MKKVLLIGAFLVLLSSCQTMVKLSEINLPVGVVAMFRSCQVHQGGVRLSVKDEQEYLGDIDLEWLIVGNRKYTYQLFEPFGRTLLAAEYVKATPEFKFSGPWAEKMPSIAVDRDGFLSIKNHLVGIKFQEIPCFLDFSLPNEWLNNVVFYSADNDSIKMKIADGTRLIAISVKNIGNKDKREACVRTQWRSWWGMVKNSYDMCFAGDGGYQAKITGMGNYTIGWTNSSE